MSFEISPLLRHGNYKKLLINTNVDPFPEVIGTFMGMDAISFAVSLLDLDAEDKILLPAYLCGDMISPFLRRTHVCFYDLSFDLVVDPERIEEILDKNKIKLLMIINYFGFLQPYRKEIKQICENRGVLLMEDCAHSLLTEESGETGDFVIYSFRKILPLPDGGGLKINMKGKKVTPTYFPTIRSNILSTMIIAKSLLNISAKSLSRAKISSKAKFFSSNTAIDKNNGCVLPLSTFAKNGMSNTSLSDVKKKRRIDYLFWQDLSSKTKKIVPFFNSLDDGVCPIGFPVISEYRDMLKSKLQKKGIILKTHWHLPDIIGGEFVNSHKLSAKMLTLPIYPELNRKAKEMISELII